MPEGVSAWDVEMFRLYVKKEQNVEIAAEPATFPNHAMLNRVNGEFATRVRALMSVYQAHRGTPRIGIIAKTGSIRSAAEQRAIYAGGRRIREERKLFEGMWLTMPVGDGSRPEHWEKVSDRPPTDAWVSWHNLGVAVDLAYTNNDAFLNMAKAAADLGMIWGGWFGGEPERVDWAAEGTTRSDRAAAVMGWDLGHVEWHPGLRQALPFESQSGTPLRDDQLRIGYKWKLPERIYVRIGTDYLAVYEFSVDDSWITATKMRTIARYTGGDWSGSWYEFSPPVRLFPAWIPTIRWSRNSSDPGGEGSTKVIVQRHTRGTASDGKKHSAYHESTGTWDYASSLRMVNWEILATIYVARDDPGSDRLKHLRDTSEYDVDLTIKTRRENPVSTRSTVVDTDGYTTEGTSTAEFDICALNLSLGWNRDRGAVGVLHEGTAFESFELIETAGDYTVSTSLPAGAFDVEQPPSWPSPNPKPPPDPVPESEGGWFRP